VVQDFVVGAHACIMAGMLTGSKVHFWESMERLECNIMCMPLRLYPRVS
jgi:hypothetical protein